MDCIFKVGGYVPRNGFCRQCEPLMKIFSFVGYERRAALFAQRNVLISYKALRANDALRDGATGIERLNATLTSKMCMLRLPNKLNEAVSRSSETIERLETSGIDARTYIEKLSDIGGEIFEKSPKCSPNSRELKLFGASVTAATIAHDIFMDLKSDIVYRRFNPLRNEEKPKDKGKELLNEFFDRFREKMSPIMPSCIITGRREILNAMPMEFCPASDCSDFCC